MEKIRTSTLKPGMVLSQTLFSMSGQKLLNGGAKLTEDHIRALCRAQEYWLLAADSVDELADAGIVDRMDNSKLSIGQRSAKGVITRAGQVLLEPGQEVEEHHLDALEASEGSFVSRDEAKNNHRDRILMADTVAEEMLAQTSKLPRRIAPLEESWLRPTDPSTWPDPQELAEWRQEQVRLLRKLHAQIQAGISIKVDHFNPLLDGLIERVRQYPSRFTQLALLCPRREDYLPDHAYTVAVLTIAMGAQLRWPVQAVRDLGLASLVSDLGMLLIPERIRVGACQLTDADRSRVHRHPLYTLSMLQAVQNVPPLVTLSAFQHHERENGSGYPQGRRREQLCDYARVICVADTFAAITEPRQYRSPKLPYLAIEETLQATRTHVFWKPAVRALIQAAGLFPVGSYVNLSNGKNAHVISANAELLDRPVVELLDANDVGTGVVVDLAHVHRDELAVVRPIAVTDPTPKTAAEMSAAG